MEDNKELMADSFIAPVSVHERLTGDDDIMIATGRYTHSFSLSSI